MAQLVAGKTMTIGGQKYDRGQPIDRDSLSKLPAGRLKQMQEQHTVYEDSIHVIRVSGKKER